ncbi:P-loop containing nucleoside triphosphate hydrolase protein [Dichomitus squalens]|uniref:P-loop containing nucleoside triphosphate hydrolase protein n=1 Tax=Dichomitus squalens TaxID=114155 RepID=A0A4Q9PXC1_9APHY|nr:P-loop containing nucleoside triphosphate hydrolase protein [Dichomitus squalens]TBU59372.1 P-loop containing nucleoside triphosphate hydrolase protein [Dichomitus squalens]
MSFCEGDGAFGPQSSCRNFDFTVVFENGVLTILPNGLFLLTAIIFAVQTRPRLSLSRRHIPVFIPFFLLLTTGALSIGGWKTASAELPHKANALVTAALALDLVSALVLILLIPIFGRSRYILFVASLYLLLTLILDTSRVRTFAIAGSAATSELFFASFLAHYATRFASLVVLSFPSLFAKNDGALENAGFLSHIFVTWALPLMWKGRHGNLEIEQLPSLDPDMDTTELYARFEVYWKAERTTHGDNASLVRVLALTFYPTFLGPVVPAAIRSLAQAVEPLMVNAIINFLQSYTTSGETPDPAQWGWALAGAFAIVFLGLAGATGQYFYYVYRGGAYIRAALVEAIYRKTLVLSADSLADAAGGDASNLMSVDIERITLAIDPLHQLWSSLVVIAIGLYILWTQIGTSFVAAVIVTAICMIATPLLSRHIDDLQDAWSGVTDKRVRLISSILHQITGVKLSAYEPELVRKVEDVRRTELAAMKRFWTDFAVVVCVTNTAMNMLSLFTLGAYAIVSFLSGSGSLTTARLFTSYTVLTIIAAPLFSVGQNYGTVLAAYGSLKRIQSFLNAPERKDPHAVDLSITDKSDSPADEKPNELGFATGTLELRGTFGWGEKKVLESIDLQIPSGKFTAVVGRVGTGKTTLLASLLGETTAFGSISRTPIRNEIAFCSQVPWLRTSLSIEQNILFSSSMDRAWFNTVVHACALDIDFGANNLDSRLAKGLSGGQKARIALARAVYSRSTVVLLDDVFAALDGTTSAHVFEALFGASGLLNDRTVVMTTNKVSHLQHMDWIVMLGDNRVIEQDSYARLLSADGPTSALVKEHVQTSSGVMEAVQQVTNFDDSLEDVDKAEAEQEEIDAIQHGSNGFAAYLHYFAGAGYPSMLIYATFLVVTVGIQIVTPVYLQLWAAANDHSSGSASSILGRYLGGYAAVEVAYSIAFTTVFYFFIMSLVPRASTALHANAFKAVMATPVSFFGSTSIGKVISRFSQDVFIVDFEFPLAMHDFGYESTRMIGSAVLMIVSVPYLAIVVAFMLVLVYVIQKFYLATSRQLRRLDLSSKGPLYTLFSETVELNGLLTIRAAGKGVPYAAANSALLARSQMPFYLTNVSRLWLATNIGVMTAVINTCFVLIAVGNRSSTSAGLFAVGLSQAVSLQDIISLVLTSWTQLEIAAVAIERNLEYTKLAPEEDDHASSGNVDTDKLWPSHGTIEFDNVIASYEGQTEPTLKGITMTMAGGSNVGLCGRTGSGKSTMLLAILRALHVRGKITIDKVDTADVSHRTLRRNITVVPQEPLIIDGTIRENVDISGDKSDAEIWEAIEAAQLKDVIGGFDDKLDQSLSARGNELSKGQTQLLALARALLRKNKIVLLDEATGNLDVETDKAVQETIRAAFKEYTVVTVAHRIGTIVDYDQVAVLDAGRVVEIGKPSQLLENEESAFARLHNDSTM